jgi:cytoskeletal protein CcmA (bactofilin family)
LNSAGDTETLVIDPVAMNIVNRVAAGSRCNGVNEYAGGLIVEGSIVGDLVVADGPLVLMDGGSIQGNVRVKGDAYLFGRIQKRDDDALSEVQVDGVVYLAESVVAQTNITAGAFKTFEGAQIEGRIKTIGRTVT